MRPSESRTEKLERIKSVIRYALTVPEHSQITHSNWVFPWRKISQTANKQQTNPKQSANESSVQLSKNPRLDGRGSSISILVIGQSVSGLNRYEHETPHDRLAWSKASSSGPKSCVALIEANSSETLKYGSVPKSKCPARAAA